MTPVGTYWRSQSEQGCVESQVMALPTPECVDSVPVPTMKFSEPDVFGAPKACWTMALEPLESGSVMQLPPLALNWAVTWMFTPVRQRRASMPKMMLFAGAVPDPSAVTLTVMTSPSLSPVRGPFGAMFDW